MPDRSTLRVLVSGPGHPATNMAIDEAILLSSGPPTLRLYGWQPAGLSLGYFQRAAEFDGFAGDHVTVRRLTGGGAIYHQDELTYSLILDAADLPAGITAGYELVHAALREALLRVGVPTESGPRDQRTSPRPEHLWCFAQATNQDLVLPGYGKILGSAQRRIRSPQSRLLQHGSLPLSRPDYPEAGCAALADARPPAGTVTALPDEVIKTVSEFLGWTPAIGTLTDGETTLATQLERDCYRNPAFLHRR